jgi:hypothetical protein
LNIRTNRLIACLVIAVLGLFAAQGAFAESNDAAPLPIADSHASGTHRFRYVPPADAATPQHVNLAGDFNNWSTMDTPMARNAAGDAFETDVALADGVHYYKFVVDGKWLKDPNSENDLEVDDNYGGKNSAVMIGPDGRHLPPPPDNAINARAGQRPHRRDRPASNPASRRLAARVDVEDRNRHGVRPLRHRRHHAGECIAALRD